MTREFFVYDGIKYKTIRGEEILIGKDKIPSGHYRRLDDNETTVYGIWLDNTENQTWLQEQVDLIARDGSSRNNQNKNCLLTDGKNNCFLMTNNTRYKSIPLNQKELDEFEGQGKKYTVFNALMSILLTIGYVNSSPIIHSTDIPNSIEFDIVNKNNKETIKMFFMPMDNHCYKYDI